jgi:hypothetical protein
LSMCEQTDCNDPAGRIAKTQIRQRQPPTQTISGSSVTVKYVRNHF